MPTQDLVSIDWLKQNLQNQDLRIVDCRWVLGKPGEGRLQYEQGHIPGAVHLDIDEHLSAKEGPGRHPIPRRYDFQKLISSLGIDRETHIIAYDEGKGAPAARLWWLLKYYAHESVSVLDGGWSAWLREEGAVEHKILEYPARDFVARPRKKMVVDKKDVDSVRDFPETLLIDARAPERYRGETEPIDKKAGHIPGAENLPFSSLVDEATGKFLSADALKKRLEALGVDKNKQVICYCGSGVTACTDILALRIAGYDAQLYEGSWSDWSSDSELSIQQKLPKE